MFNKKHKKEQNIQENANKFVESIDNSIQNYKNYNKINNLYEEKIVKSIIKNIFLTKEYVDLEGKKYCIDNSSFFMLNEKGIITIIYEANRFIENNTKDDIIKFIKHINSKNFKIHLKCTGFIAVTDYAKIFCNPDSSIRQVPININMKNIFNNEDSYFEHIIYTVDFSEYKQTEFPENLMAKPYKYYLEHLIESNKPTNKRKNKKWLLP